MTDPKFHQSLSAYLQEEPHLEECQELEERLMTEQGFKSYLLGELAPREHLWLEGRLWQDPQAYEVFEMVEDELIEDYCNAALSEHEQERFDRFFIWTEERKQKLALVKNLRSHVAGNRKIENRGNAFWEAWRAFWRFRNPVQSWSLAAALLVIAVGGPLLIMQNMQIKGSAELANARDAERELVEIRNQNLKLIDALKKAQANEIKELKMAESFGTRSHPPEQIQLYPTSVSLSLTPGLLRDVGETKSVLIPAGTDLLELELTPVPADYSRFQIALEQMDGGEIFTQIFPKTKSMAQSQTLKFSITAEPLVYGDYVVKLSGAVSNGDFVTLDSYYFRIIRD